MPHFCKKKKQQLKLSTFTLKKILPTIDLNFFKLHFWKTGNLMKWRVREGPSYISHFHLDMVIFRIYC